MSRLSATWLLSLLLGCCPLIASTESQALAASIRTVKPLALDVCWGENDAPFDITTDNVTGVQVPVVTRDFYYHCFRSKIAVANEDIGKVALAEAGDISYRIAPATGGLYDVTVLLDFHLAGRQDCLQTLKLKPGQWAVHSVFTRKTSGGDTFYFYAVVRLADAAAKTP